MDPTNRQCRIGLSLNKLKDMQNPDTRKAYSKVGTDLAKYALSIVTGDITLGAEGVLPSRHIESFLRVFKQFIHNLPSR